MVQGDRRESEVKSLVYLGAMSLGSLSLTSAEVAICPLSTISWLFFHGVGKEKTLNEMYNEIIFAISSTVYLLCSQPLDIVTRTHRKARVIHSSQVPEQIEAPALV